MPVPMSTECYRTLLQVMMDVGAVSALAQQPISTWSISRITHAAQGIADASEKCEIFSECREDAQELVQNLKLLAFGGEEADPGKVPEQLDLITEGLSYFMSCMFDTSDAMTKVTWNGQDKTEYRDFPWSGWPDYPTEPRRQKVR
jgi:hypothetical protein